MRKCPLCDGDGLWSDENDEYVCIGCQGEGEVDHTRFHELQSEKNRQRMEGQIRRAKAHDRDMARNPSLRRDIAMLGGDPSL